MKGMGIGHEVLARGRYKVIWVWAMDNIYEGIYW